MSVLVNQETRILCQGITGSQGSFHAEQCIEYGSNIVAGVTREKADQLILMFLSLIQLLKRHPK